MDEINCILDELNNIEFSEPQTVNEALQQESHKLYLYYCLEITEQKLTNTLNKKTMDKMQNLKEVFNLCKKTHVVENEDVFLNNLYK